ncbi:ABC transporter permease [Roseibium salinum]|uniref:ABC transporter permease n=1 Tax=Roseibium salinum TaxID=1604349 RepID=A0ABT3QW69_9HYPH|nr:ABC transporter permease [Roseibium sp. DSM 29163]MCX2721174.1 ABC transporter permease [Roseibium sp. DSM 29163]
MSETALPPGSASPAGSLWKSLAHIAYVLRENPLTAVSFGMFAFFIGSALFGPALVPYDPLETNAAAALQPPSFSHWFGTDNVGRDVFSRVIVATRLDLIISVSAVALSFVVGSFAGAIAGYRGGWTDILLNRLLDTIMAFPLFVLAMGIVAALGNSVANIIYATAIINIPFYARLVRTEVNIRREAGFTQAAKLAGNSDTRVLAFHIFPNALPPMMVQVSLNLGWAVLNAAGLSFIGLGVRPPTPEWGIMVAEGANFIISGEWWLALFPGLWLMLAVFTFNLMGDGLRDIVDPRRRT